MSPHYKTNTIFAHKTIIGLLAIIAVSFVFAICFNDSVLAYSASISTSGTVEIDVLASGDGVSIGTDNVVVDSTCPLGYTLSISGGTDNYLYKGGDNTSEYKIAPSAGTSDSPLPVIGAGYLDTWGYTTESNVTINSSFIGLTSSTNSIFTKNTGSASGGDTIPVHYGVSVDNMLDPGIYTMAEGNAITYYLTANANCASYSIEYDGNNADEGSMGTMKHTGVTENSSIDLYPSNYSRDGYGFAGWSTEQIDPDASNAATLISTAAANGNIYGPMATITADANFLSHAVVSDNKLVVMLYAVWVKPVDNATLQDFICPDNTAMPVGSVIALKDQRDSNAYAVAKLADGNCWMIENLRLDNTAAHNSDGSLAQGYGGQFAGLANPEDPWTNKNNDANSLYSIDGSDGTINIGVTSRDYRIPRYNNFNILSRDSSPSSGINKNIYSYGNYYTWSAALANTNSYTSATAQVDGKTSETANTSICPAGWRLPYGRDTGNGANSGGFYHLNYKINNNSNVVDETASNNLRSYPNNFVYSGSVGSGSVYTRGNSGLYWSSTTGYLLNSVMTAYSLVFGSGGVDPGTNTTGYKYYGRSVRCVASTDYIVYFDANGGSGTMSDQTIPVGVATNLSANTFTAPNGKVFVGWNTAADGNGTSYTDVQSVTDIVTPGKTITLYAQWDTCVSNKICYLPNAADNSVVGTMGLQSASASAGITLLASNFSREGYGFAGWNTAPDYSGTFYGPQQTITTPADMSNGLPLYAIWVASAGSFQEATDVATVCGSLTTAPTDGTANLSSISALTDQRDNETYAIAKLADGNCWMIENLRLENTAAHNSDGSLAQGYGGQFAGLADPEAPWANNSTDANSLYSTDGSGGTINLGTTNASYRIPRYNNINTPTSVSDRPDHPTANSFNNTTSGMYSYGNYYTWSAAIADTTSNGVGDYDTTSICPTGWKLPYGNSTGNGASSGGFYNLNYKINNDSNVTDATASKKLRAYPNNFVYSGYVDNGSVYNRGSGGYYWSSTGTTPNAYGLVFGASRVYLSYEYYKYYGRSVRCVLPSA